MAVSHSVMFNRVAAARPKALPMADGQTIGKLRLPLPPTTSCLLCPDSIAHDSILFCLPCLMRGRVAR